MSPAADGDLVFLHRFQERGLRLGRRAIDFVGQDHVARRSVRGGSGTRACPVCRSSCNDLRARDVGRHQVGGELDAAELERQGIGEGADHERLGQPRHAHQQAVAARKQGHQQFFDYLPLPDDHLAELLGDQIAGFVELLYGLEIVVLSHVRLNPC